MSFNAFDAGGRLKTDPTNVVLTTDVTGVLPTANGGTSVNIATAALPLGSGQITFPASQNASGGANVLDDYEEGTWTPVDASGAGLSFSIAAGIYVKTGRTCQVTMVVGYPATASAAIASIGGLPFTVSSVDGAMAVGFYSLGVTPPTYLVNNGATTLAPYSSGGTLTNAQLASSVQVIGGTYTTTA